MNVMFVVNNAYVNQLLVTLNSLFLNQKASIQIYLITDGLTDNNLSMVEKFVNKRNGKLFYKCYKTIGINIDKLISHRWNPIVFYKLYGIFDIREIKRILYLDVDIIVDADLSELYNTDLEGYYAAVVHDNGLAQVYPNYHEHVKQLMVKLEEYFNAGVMMLNLEKIQQDMTLKYLIKQYNRYAGLFVYNEQDLLNMVWNSKLKYADYKYNRLATDFRYRKAIEKDREAAIYHYTVNKPWIKGEASYQWCIKKYLQYCRLEETKEFYFQIKKHNFNLWDRFISGMKTAIQYNPLVFTSEECGYQHFFKKLFFMGGDG